MAIGNEKQKPLQHSPIVDAIAAAEEGTTAEIRVHLTRRRFEKDAFPRAQRLFYRFDMHRTGQRNAVLIYINLRRHKYALVADEGASAAAGDRFWRQLGQKLREDLQSTYFENAISLSVQKIGEMLKRHFPSSRG